MDNKQIQVNKDNYEFSKYVPKTRWSSFWHQISEIYKLGPESVLVIGVGDNIIENIIRSQIKIVHTFDIDPELKPDICGSIKDLSSCCTQKYDSIICCQVLEHLPFSNFESCIKQISDTTNKYCILSLPQKYYFSFHLVISILWKKKSFFISRIKKNVKHTFDGQHYWEIGAKESSLKDVKNIVEKYFSIKREYTVQENPYHRFFILGKRN